MDVCPVPDGIGPVLFGMPTGQRRLYFTRSYILKAPGIFGFLPDNPGFHAFSSMILTRSFLHDQPQKAY